MRKDLIGDFRLIKGASTNMQSAIPDRALLVAPSNTEHPEAIYLCSYVPLDDPLLDFTDRQRRAPLVFSKEFEVALSVILRAQSQ